MNFADVPVPDRLAKLPRDRRGYPIPVGVYRDESGRPHFTINDEPLRQRHMAKEICPLCGDKLFRGRWFVGGPRAAFHEHGAFIDPPMHTECVHYALQVCPFLAAPSYARRIEDRTLADNDRPGLLLVEEECRIERPPLFVAVMTTGQIPVRFEEWPVKGSIRFLRPKRPYMRVEYWQHGRQMADAEALPLVESDMAALAADETKGLSDN